MQGKPVQHFIQHRIFVMLDEMLDWFAHLQNFEILKKEEKKCVGLCWMKFVRYQTFHPTISARSKKVFNQKALFFMLDWFGGFFIQHIHAFRYSNLETLKKRSKIFLIFKSNVYKLKNIPLQFRAEQGRALL